MGEKKQKRDTGRCQVRGRVPSSNRVVRDGLSDDRTSTEELQKWGCESHEHLGEAFQADGTARMDMASLYPLHFASTVVIIFDTIYILAKCILVSWITLQAPWRQKLYLSPCGIHSTSPSAWCMMSNLYKKVSEWQEIRRDVWLKWLAQGHTAGQEQCWDQNTKANQLFNGSSFSSQFSLENQFLVSRYIE